jgi:hypothetical protein
MNTSTFSSFQKIVDKNIATVIDGPYGWGKSTRIPNYFASQKYKIIVAVPDIKRTKQTDYPMISYDNMIDVMLLKSNDYDLYIIDAVDTNYWQIEVILSIWLFKKEKRILCIGTCPVTDKLVSLNEMKSVWINFEQYPIFNIYAAEKGLLLDDLLKSLYPIKPHCIIEGRLPQQEIGTCDKVIIRDPRSRYYLTIILSKLGLKNSVTVYYLNTKEMIADLPEIENVERSDSDKYKIIYAFVTRKLPVSALIFSTIMPLYRLLNNYGIADYYRINNLNWNPCCLYILYEMDNKKIGNMGRFALSLMAASGLLFNFQGLRDDAYFRLVKAKFLKYQSENMLEVYLKIAEEFIRENPINIEKWATDHSFYFPYIFNVVITYRIIQKREKELDIKEYIKFFKDCAQKIFKTEPNRLLQLNEKMNGYTNPEDILFIVEDLLVTDKPNLLVYLDNMEKYVKSYIPFS